MREHAMGLDVGHSAVKVAASETLAALIVERIERVFGSYLRDVAGAIVVGGAPLVFDTIKKRWKHASMPKNPRFAVAEGMRRYAMQE